jgi:putative tryptophan/tyrosine transport system substrate-binding protein
MLVRICLGMRAAKRWPTPIVFTWVSDSVGSGYVASFAHPGGNITGFHNYEPALGAKWIGILKEIAPAVRRVAFVHVPEITANVAFVWAKLPLPHLE